MVEASLLVSSYATSAWRIAAPSLNVPVSALATDDLLLAHLSSISEETKELRELFDEFGEDVACETLIEALLNYAVDKAKQWRTGSSIDLVASAYVELLAERASPSGFTPVRNAFVAARFKTADLSRRVSFEFLGCAQPLPTARNAALQTRLAMLFAEEGFSDHVELEYLDAFIHVGRAGRQRSPMVVSDGRRRALPHRPAMTEALHHEPNTGKLRVTARNRRLANDYALVMGEVFFDDKTYFEDAGSDSLELLRDGDAGLDPKRRDVFERVELMSFVGVSGSATVTGKRGDLRRVIAAFDDIEFMEAKLRIYPCSGSRFDVQVRVGKGLVVGEPRYTGDVERYLEDVGVRGHRHRGDDLARLIARGAAKQQEWRSVFGSTLDELIVAGVLETVSLTRVPNADGHGTLSVQQDAGVTYGIGLRPEDSSRPLSPSDVEGLRLVPQQLAKFIAVGLDCLVQLTELDGGRVWLLGRRHFFDEIDPQVVLVLGPPTAPLSTIVDLHLPNVLKVVVYPEGTQLADAGVPFRWNALARLPNHIIQALGVHHRQPIEQLSPDGLAIGKESGILAFKGRTADLIAGSTAHRFISKLAEAFPERVATTVLDEHLNPHRDDGASARQARGRLKAILDTAEIPIDEILGSGGGGYKLKLPPRVV